MTDAFDVTKAIIQTPPVAGLWSRSRRLGLETVLRRTNVSSRSRLGVGHLRLVPKTNALTVSWWACRWRRPQCERALDVVAYAVVTIARRINKLKTMNVKMITSRPVIAINKTCTLTSRSHLKSYKRLVSVASFYVSCASLLDGRRYDKLNTGVCCSSRLIVFHAVIVRTQRIRHRSHAL